MANPGYWAQPQQAYGQVSPPPGPISPGQIYPSQFQTPFMGHAKAPPPPPQLPQNSQWTGHAGHGGQGQYQQGFGQQPLAHQQQVGQYPGPYPPTGHYPGPQRVSPMPSPPLIAPAPSPPNMYRPPAQAQTHQAQAQTDPRLWDAGRARHETRYQSSQMFESYVRERNLHAFYDHKGIQDAAARVSSSDAIQTLARTWRIPFELAVDLAKLSLYDVAIIVNDSGSMRRAGSGSRVRDLKKIVGRIAEAHALFRNEGIELRALNTLISGSNIQSEVDALAWVDLLEYNGDSPFGDALDYKVLQPLVMEKLRANAFRKPLLVIIVTDTPPSPKDRDILEEVMYGTHDDLKKTRYGPNAVAYQFVQVGDDVGAQRFLHEYVNVPASAPRMDRVLHYELEKAHMARSRVDLTMELWLFKVLLGAIDSEYHHTTDNAPPRK